MLLVKVHTVYWQYHSSVSALPLVPTALGTSGNTETNRLVIFATVCMTYLMPLHVRIFISLLGGGGGGEYL